MELIETSAYWNDIKPIKSEIRSSISNDSPPLLWSSSSPSTSSHSTSRSGDSEEKELPVFNKFNPPSFCLICLASAKCHHYGIPSCSGCKTFFRRSILLTPKYVCKSVQDCQDIKRCRACRFDKCLITGMNPYAVLIPPGTTNAFEIEVFIQRHLNRLEITCPKLNLDTKREASMPKLLINMDIEKDKSLNYLIFLETKMSRLRMSDYNPVNLYSYTVKDLMNKEVELGKADKYQIITKHANIKLYLLIDIILSIDLARLLPMFQSLDNRDQELILKYSGLALAIFTQVFYSYKNKHDTLVLPDGSTPIRCMKQRNRLELECFCRCIEPADRSQITAEEYVLAKAIVVFNPAIPGISLTAQNLLTSQREYFADILLQHEQQTYGSGPGAIKYSKIMSTIEAMYHFAQRQREFHTISYMQFISGGETPWPKAMALNLFKDSVL